MKSKLVGRTVLVVATLLGGYAVASDAGAAPAMPGGRGMMDSICPMKVQGAAVEPKDMDGAVAFVFTTKGGVVDDIRRRVRHMAQMHRAPDDLKVRRDRFLRPWHRPRTSSTARG